MAVFTVLTKETVQDFLNDYELGELLDLRGIPAGIENTNYFLDTTQGSFVLTVFEVLKFEQLPFYIELMYHLANQGLPVPMPQRRIDGSLIGVLHHKPATIVTKLSGKYIQNPNIEHCRLAATTQAQLHLASKNFPRYQANLRGISWWQEQWPKIQPYISQAQADFYQRLLEEQVAVQQSDAWQSLPSGPCHCDMFRDNVLFAGTDQKPVMGGVIDFYFAGCDQWLFDLAVAVNDWCVIPGTGELEPERTRTWLSAYDQVRPLTDEEKSLWPVALRAAGLRFWTSRLYDFYMPRPAESLKPHDPSWFEKILIHRTGSDAQYLTLLPNRN